MYLHSLILFYWTTANPPDIIRLLGHGLWESFTLASLVYLYLKAITFRRVLQVRPWRRNFIRGLIVIPHTQLHTPLTMSLMQCKTCRLCPNKSSTLYHCDSLGRSMTTTQPRWTSRVGQFFHLFVIEKIWETLEMWTSEERRHILALNLALWLFLLCEIVFWLALFSAATLKYSVIAECHYIILKWAIKSIELALLGSQIA